MKKYGVILAMLFIAFSTIIIGSSARAEDTKLKSSLGLLKKEYGPDYGFSKIDKTAKTRIAEEMLKNSAYLDFYSLLSVTRKEDALYFKQAFKKYGKLEGILAVGEHIKKSMDEFKTLVGENTDDKTRADELMKGLGEELMNKLKPLDPEFSAVAEKNVRELLDIVRTATIEMTTSQDTQALGAIVALKSLGEEGFSIILRSVKSEADLPIVGATLSAFGANALIPTLRCYEDPTGVKFHEELAKEILKSMSFDCESVVDKAVEATKNGRLIKKIPVEGLEGLYSLPETFWDGILVDAMKGKSNVVKYIIKKHVPSAKGNELGNLIVMISKIDFKSASAYLNNLNPSKLDDNTADALFTSFQPQNSLDGNDPCTTEKFESFTRFFLRCKPEQRVFKMPTDTSFSLRTISKFYIDNFNMFTGDERKKVINFCFGNSPEHPPYPENLRGKVLNGIIKSCTEKEKSLIDSLSREAE